ncbi:hypothetical protein CERZMDRAFT_95581 [Cercospora zeae-maydis SCOH1-5]|uniref:AMP-dependent synthetase/ligase domain-containing protein n=1 Tax=Cercospora zeae-maydis SCOH1-5 TaxID=717836 RepID=A0A6A6FLH0_9PEZI|nr:hypothetical protein CERZMDRAFT_95581 [Cercospora zeae-maydis SCOH1-5]
MSDQVAAVLKDHGVGPEDYVPFRFEKSIWAVIAMLGVLKAGGAFVPLDITIITLGNCGLFQVVTDNDHNLLPTPEQSLDRCIYQKNSNPPLPGQQLFHLATFTPHEHINLIVTIPHSLFDGWSLRPILRAVEQVYHRAVSTPGLVPYNRFNEYLHHTRAESAAAEFWKTSLSDFQSPHFPLQNYSTSMDIQARTFAPHDVFHLLQSFAHVIDQLHKGDAPPLGSVTPLASHQLDALWSGNQNVVKLSAHFLSDVMTTLAQFDHHSNPEPEVELCATSWLIDPLSLAILSPIGAVGELIIEGCQTDLGDKASSELAQLDDPPWLLASSQSYAGRHGRLFRTGYLARRTAPGTFRIVARNDSAAPHVKGLEGNRPPNIEIVPQHRLESLEAQLRDAFATVLEVPFNTITPATKFFPFWRGLCLGNACRCSVPEARPRGLRKGYFSKRRHASRSQTCCFGEILGISSPR